MGAPRAARRAFLVWGVLGWGCGPTAPVADSASHATATGGGTTGTDRATCAATPVDDRAYHPVVR